MASPLTIHALPERLRGPVLIMAFAGWNDASEAATTAARYLAQAWPAEKIATIDPEGFDRLVSKLCATLSCALAIVLILPMV